MDDIKGLEKQIDTLFALNDEIQNSNNSLKIENSKYKKLYEDLCINLKEFESMSNGMSLTETMLKIGCFLCGIGIGEIVCYLISNS